MRISLVSHRRSRRAAALCAAAAACCLAALPSAASAQLFQPNGEFGSGSQPSGRFGDISAIATDDAGRVYVADAGAGRVEVYDSATNNHTLLAVIGEGRIVRPTGIAIDNRSRVYVADAGRDLVDFYDSFVDGFRYRRSFGGSGTAIGNLGDPRHLVADRAGQAFVVERANARVQWFKPSGGQSEPVAAFGVSDPPAFQEPEGIDRDGFERVYVSDDNAGDGEIRVFDPRGALLRGVGGPGAGASQWSSPRGLMLDPFGRLIVADAGNARVQVLSSLEAGLGFLDAYGTPGAGTGNFSQPTDVSLAPGALLYVADRGNGRVVRLRYDDADTDGALDVRDNCRGLANPDQRNSDGDPAGDACDPDDDNDGIPDDQDRCPVTRRGVDANRDGCGDPSTKIFTPRNGKSYKRRRPPSRVAGVASADELGVLSVKVAVARVSRGRCTWLSRSGRRARRAACNQPSQFVAAKGTDRWVARVRIRGKGTFRIVSRAVQNGGVSESLITKRNVRTVKIR